MKVLQAIIDFMASGSVRRAIVAVLGLGLAALNKKLGLNLDADQLYGVVAVVLGYIAQSAAREASDAHADAKVALAEAIEPKLVQPAAPSDIPVP